MKKQNRTIISFNFVAWMKQLEMVDWINTWRSRCSHHMMGPGHDACIGCSSKRDCNKAIREIRKMLRKEVG